MTAMSELTIPAFDDVIKMYYETRDETGHPLFITGHTWEDACRNYVFHQPLTADEINEMFNKMVNSPLIAKYLMVDGNYYSFET